jgi:soluble lytic murein transglycosylase
MLDASDGQAAEPLDPKLPPTADLFHRLGLDGDAEAHLKSEERAALSQTPGREREGLCNMYGKLSRATRRFRIGYDGLRGSLLSRAPSPRTEWAWRCVYPQPYESIVDSAASRESIPKGLVYAIMRQESAYDPDVVSYAHAVGLMQILPETARRIAAETGTAYEEKSLSSVAVNVDLGSRYLGKMMRTFGSSVPLAAAAYNAGPIAVSRWLDSSPVDLDLWVARIPFEETRTYVQRVVENYARYAYLDGGENAVVSLDLSLPKDTHVELSTAY